MLSDTVRCVSADSSALEKPQLHSTICYIYHKLDILWHDFCIDSLLKTLSFDHNFSVSARSTSFFGVTGYSYLGAAHKPQPIENNPIILRFFNAINSIFPNAKPNSVLVNFYPDLTSHIPFHSDIQQEVSDSLIFTISLGCSRWITFRNADSKCNLVKILLQHGDLLVFSRFSQIFYQH